MKSILRERKTIDKIFRIRVLLATLGVIIICSFFYFAYQRNIFQIVCIKENCFYVELAKTEAKRERGLMNREKLNNDNGMLFVFEKEGIYPFWMKNTLMPLDIIWLNKDKKIVYVSENNNPCIGSDCPQINPGILAMYVLEINAGVSSKIGLRVGDELLTN
jgi:uncharacterized membrane protein (UPF0127 family)